MTIVCEVIGGRAPFLFPWNVHLGEMQAEDGQTGRLYKLPNY